MTTRLNLCLPLAGPWAVFARQACRELSAVGNLIDLSSCVPHVTIFMASFPDDAIGSAAEALRTMAAQVSAFDVDVGGFIVRGGYVFLEVQDAPSLQLLHGLALAALPPLRRGLRVEKEHQRVAERTPDLLPTFERYGSSRVAEHYHPHLTLARLPAAASLPEIGAARPQGSLRFETLALGRGGENGVVEEILVAEPLATSP